MKEAAERKEIKGKRRGTKGASRRYSGRREQDLEDQGLVIDVVARRVGVTVCAEIEVA